MTPYFWAFKKLIFGVPTDFGDDRHHHHREGSFFHYLREPVVPDSEIFQKVAISRKWLIKKRPNFDRLFFNRVQLFVLFFGVIHYVVTEMSQVSGSKWCFFKNPWYFPLLSSIMVDLPLYYRFFLLLSSIMID